jgi:hypothetical protein
MIKSAIVSCIAMACLSVYLVPTASADTLTEENTTSSMNTPSSGNNVDTESKNDVTPSQTATTSPKPTSSTESTASAPETSPTPSPSTNTASPTPTDAPTEKDTAALKIAQQRNKQSWDKLNGIANGKDAKAVMTWNSSAVANGNALNQFKSLEKSAIQLLSTQYYRSSSSATSIDTNTKQLDNAVNTLRSKLTETMNSHEDKKGQLAMPALRNLIRSANSLVSSSNHKVADNSTRIRLANQLKSTTSYSRTSSPRINQINAHKNALNTLMARVKSSEVQLNRARAAAAARARYLRSIRVVRRTASNMNCSPSKRDSTCQRAVDTGRFVKITYSGISTVIFAQHNNRGGNWINGLHNGQGVIVNNVLYVVHNQATRQIKVPGSGIYLQTCTTNGQGIRLVHLVRP